MANFRALTVQAGVTTQIQDANKIIVGAGITTAAGGMAISSAGGTTTMSDVVAFAGGATASGAVAFDLSGSSGAFKTPTGAVTIGPGAVTVSGATTFTAAGTAVTVNNNMTVTGTLTAGTILVSGLLESGLTTAAMAGGTGQVGYWSAADTLTPTDSAAIATSRVAAVYLGVAGQAQTTGVVAAALMTTAGGSPGNGSPVWLANAADDGATGAGKLTATAPSTGIVAEFGICQSNANYAGAKTAKILIQVKAPIVL